MDSAKSTAAGAAAAHPPNGRKHHKPSSSLGSLYEVLADLDENQLDYLLQEMNHTGHENVKVAQAVSVFDAQSPSDSLRNSMLPSTPDLQRQTSKSQQGKLRLQTAFQRVPSLKQRPQTDFRASLRPTGGTAESPHGTPRSRKPSVPEAAPLQPVVANFSTPVPTSEIHLPSRPDPDTTLPPFEPQHQGHYPPPEPELNLPKRTTTTSARRPTTSSTRSTSAYKRISRPDFNLPPGITLPDLLHLLETEFLNATSASPISASPASASPVSPFAGGFAGGFAGLSPSPRRTLRKHSSRLDLALEAERNPRGIEEVGLGLLEPRGSPNVGLRRASAASLRSRSRTGTPDGFERNGTPPVVMEGIFDVLENR